MRIAIITANIGDIDNINQFDDKSSLINNQILREDITVDFHVFTEKNLPFPLPNLDNRLKSKYIKIQTHKFLKDYDYFIWLDGRIEVISEHFVTEMLKIIGKKNIAISKHDQRENIIEELEYILDRIKKENKYLYLRYANQCFEQELEFYKKQKEQIQNTPLYHCAYFIRKTDKKTNDVFDQWWEKCIQFSNFDQAMFSYVCYTNNIKIRTILRKQKELLISNNKHQRNNISLSTKDIVFMIKKHLILKKPLSIVRYGDGEAMILDKDENSKEHKDFVFKRQLGTELLEDHKSYIISHLRQAYKEADVIGLPTSRHINKGNYWQKAQGILESHVLFNKEFCSIDIHQDLLSNNYFDTLLNNREKVYYISAYNIDNQLKEKYNIKHIESFQIAPEMKFAPNYEGDKHYPDQFNQIQKWIKTLDCEGALCLVGAGITGKLYNIWFKDQGGVSIDIGSVFDSWVGKETRGKNRSSSATDLKHVL